MRDMIVRTAQDQLKQGGYDNLSFAVLSETFSTTRANLHHHFKNKEGLAREATERYIEENLAFMQSLGEKHRGDFPGYLAELEALFLASVEARGRAGACICSQFVRESGVPKHLLELSQDFFRTKDAFLEKMVTQSQENGTLRKDADPKRLATTASTLLLGIAQKALANGEDSDFTASMRGTLVDWIEDYKL